MLCGLQWHLEAHRRRADNGVPRVGAYVCCSSDSEGSWKCKATCIFRVVSTVADDVVRRTCDEFTHSNDNWGYDDLMSVEVSRILCVGLFTRITLHRLGFDFGHEKVSAVPILIPDPQIESAKPNSPRVVNCRIRISDLVYETFPIKSNKR